MERDRRDEDRGEAEERVRQVLSAMAATALRASPRTLAVLNLRLLGMSPGRIARRLRCCRATVYADLRRASAASRDAAAMLDAIRGRRTT